MLHRALVLVVVQPEEHNMYDQHWLCAALKERYPFHLQYCLSCVEFPYCYWNMFSYHKENRDIVMDRVNTDKFFFNEYQKFEKWWNVHQFQNLFIGEAQHFRNHFPDN
jgi:hypothetical protein